MIAVVLVLLGVLWAAPASAFTYYVSAGGYGDTPSNSNSCVQARTITTPKRWLHDVSGTDGALACLAAGDTLLVRGGTYDEQIDIGYNATLASGTSWSNKIRIANYPNGCSPNAAHPCGTAGETVTLQPTTATSYTGDTWTFGLFANVQYIEIDGINVDNSVAAGSTGVQGVVAMQCEGGGILSNYIRVMNAEFIGDQGEFDNSGAGDQGGGDNFTLHKRFAHAQCPGGHEILNNKIHGGATNTAGWSTCTPSGANLNCRYTSYGFYLETDNTLIENNEIYDTRYLGIQIYGNGHDIVGTIIRNNSWHDITRQAYPSGSTGNVGIITGSNPVGLLIVNNLVYNVAGMGIYCYDGSSGTGIYFNTVYGNSTQGISTSAGCSGTIIRNNISHVNGTNYSNAGSGTTEDHNLRVGTDPDFVSAGTGDFHLNSATGPAVDVGLCLGQVPTDFEGTARPQGLGCDIGAYEYLVAGSVPGVPTDLIPLAGATGVDLFPALSFTSTNATAYRFYFSDFTGQSSAFSTDLFNVPNSSDLGAEWLPFLLNPYTNAQISSQRVRSVTVGLDSAERWTGRQFAADQWARIRISTLGTGVVGVGVMLRVQNVPQLRAYVAGVVKGVSTYRTWIWRFDGGVETLLASEDTTAWAANDLLEARIVGNTISIFRNGNTDLRLSVQDPLASYASGDVGIHLFADSTGQAELDNFEAGEIGPVLVGTFGTPSYVTPALNPNTVYYWKPEGVNSQGTTTGAVVSFTTLGTTATPVGIRLRCVYGTANCP